MAFGMNYLITGGAGFIGSHLADALIGRGDTVSALDNLSTGSARNVAHLIDHEAFSLRRGSVQDEELLTELVEWADVVVHLAASVGVQLIVQRPLESVLNNVRGTEAVLEQFARMGTRVLVTSTSEIYGKNGKGPMAEDADRVLGSPFKARWSYSATKALDEVLAYSYWRERGTPSTVVRLFNTVGPRQTGVYGMVVPRFVKQALAGKDLTVFGDGEQQRCFCHVRDVVEALLALLDHPDSVGDVYNIGSQEEVTINELAKRVLEISGSSSGIAYIPYEVAYEEGFEDMPRRIPDTTKIRSLTGWAPRFELNDILTDVLRYERILASASTT